MSMDARGYVPLSPPHVLSSYIRARFLPILSHASTTLNLMLLPPPFPHCLQQTMGERGDVAGMLSLYAATCQRQEGQQWGAYVDTRYMSTTMLLRVLAGRQDMR